MARKGHGKDPFLFHDGNGAHLSFFGYVKVIDMLKLFALGFSNDILLSILATKGNMSNIGRCVWSPQICSSDCV